MDSAFGGKATGMTNQIAQLALDHANLAHEALKVAFTQIGFQGGADISFVLFYRTLQFFEHGDAEFHRKGSSAAEKLTLIF